MTDTTTFKEDLQATEPEVHLALTREPDFVNGDYHIHWLEEFIRARR